MNIFYFVRETLYQDQFKMKRHIIDNVMNSDHICYGGELVIYAPEHMFSLSSFNKFLDYCNDIGYQNIIVHIGICVFTNDFIRKREFALHYNARGFNISYYNLDMIT